jgi:hypothetical protein
MPATYLNQYEADMRYAPRAQAQAVGGIGAVGLTVISSGAHIQVNLTDAPATWGGMTMAGGKLVLPVAGHYRIDVHGSFSYPGDALAVSGGLSVRDAAAGATVAPGYYWSGTRLMLNVFVGGVVNVVQDVRLPGALGFTTVSFPDIAVNLWRRS